MASAGVYVLSCLSWRVKRMHSLETFLTCGMRNILIRNLWDGRSLLLMSLQFMLRLCSFMFKYNLFLTCILKTLNIWIASFILNILFLRRRSLRHLRKDAIESHFWGVRVIKCKTSISYQISLEVQNICLSSLMRLILSRSRFL